MTTGRPFLLLLPAAAMILAAGCSDLGPPAASSSAAGTSPEPAAAVAQASQEAAADPAAATDARSAALAVALRAADLPSGWTVQANPLPDAGDLSKNPTLAGICAGTFASEAHRTAKFPVTGIDPRGTASVAAESVSYDSAASAAEAVAELRAAFDSCPAEGRTLVPAPAVTGLVPGAVVVEYELAGGVRQEVVAQSRGAILSVLIGEDEATVARTTRSIATRLSALPARAIGL